MTLSASSPQFGINMGSTPGYTGYPNPPGVPGLGIPPPVPSLADYRNHRHQPHLMSQHMHSLPTPQPQPLGKWQCALGVSLLMFGEILFWIDKNVFAI